MRNYTLTICCVLGMLFCNAQDSYYDIVEPRIEVIQKNNRKLNLNKYIVLTNDTLFTSLKNEPNLDFIESSKERRKILYRYKTQIFRYSNSVHVLKQWNCDIIIYLDKQISKEVRNEFITFFEQINGLKNLNISFTSKLRNANYYFKVTSETVNAYGDDYTFDSEEDRLKDIYTGATYNLITDGNYKNRGGVLKINIINSDNEKLLKQIKQLFYTSLGQFYISTSFEETSLLSKNYNNSSTISDNDLELLKMHYTIIYDQKINGTTFNRLQKLKR